MNHNPLGLKSVVYHGDFRLGEVEIFSTTTDQNNLISFPNNEIRINYLSQQSERCLPLSILQTISLNTVRFKLNSTSPASIASQSDLATLYYSCLRELKTAVIVRGEEELHLVPMMSKQEKDKLPCFWGCSVPVGIYEYCLGLLNLRCLSIVFDLDETLIVANTMRSFEDRIEFLQKKLECEDDPLRVSGMSAELRRYVEDRSLLKQYIETDSVVDNGKLVKVQFEEVTAQPVDKERVVRPIIRLKERNIVLTRINPEVRDTSVLVRLRPAWEDLRSYLNARGRKRFEVYVCTMAERDYALEMWRLLDPEAHLIQPDQLPSRVVCVKSGAKKSLSSIFHNGTCHPKMAMVIDDRLKVWEDTDQPRVHVVPAFTPYYAPQAETANAVPVLCVARNVACNVRAGFFKEFDENLLRRIYELSYEDDIATLPSSPDVSDFLLPEDTVFVPNGNRDIPFPEGMRDAEVEERLNKVDVSHPVDFVPPLVPKVPEIRPETSQQPASPPSNDVSLELSKANVPLQKSGLPEASSRIEVNPPELDPDKRRRLFGMHYVRDTRAQNSSDPSFLKPPVNASPAIQSSRGWLLGEDSTSDQINNQSASLPQEYDASQDEPRVHQNLHFSRAESGLPGTSSRVPEVKIEETLSRQEGKKLNHSLSSQSLRSGDTTTNQATKEFGSDAEKVGVLPSYLYIGVLQEIGRKCGSKIEYRSVVNTSKDLQFSVEVLFTGEKIAAGSGKTKKDAQQQAAENALRTLADEYRAYESGSMNRDLEQLSLGNDNGFLWDDPGPDDASPSAHSSGPGGGAVTNSFETHEARKRPSSPRPGESFQNKRLKGEFTSGLQVGSSQYKNGNTVS